MCNVEVLIQKTLCSVTVCRKCRVYVLHIGPMSFRLEEEIFDELSEMFTDYSFGKKLLNTENSVTDPKH